MDRAMVFGKYCLLERISVGGMAEVFRAKPLPARGSNKYLALKRILPHLAEDEEFITMFVDEAKLTVQLQHPNIVETYELGSFQSSHYILMEFIAGADVLSLQKRLREKRKIMSVAQACYIASRVGRGLHYAHTATDEQGRPFNIIHRDVSPQNIRLTFDGRVKLIDFGIAKAAVQRTKTQVGVLKGKFGYMSPEQVHGEQIDHRSDVFALGTTLWEMLTNRRLFNGDNEFETLQMVKHPEIPPPSEKNSQVPPQVDEIVMRALAEDRNQRYQTAAELAEALEEFLQGIREPYTRDHLADWMGETYSEELAEEQRKRELYREIETVDDIAVFNENYADEPEEKEEATGEPVAGTAEVEVEEGDTKVDEQVWHPDFAPDTEENVDHEEFAANHTVVAAGGFDPSEFEDETDEVTSVGEEPHAEPRETDEMGKVDAAEPKSVEVDPDRTVPIEEQDVGTSPPPLEELVEGDESRGGDETREQQRPPAEVVERASTPSGGTAPVAQDSSYKTLKIVSAVAAVVALLGVSGALGYMLVLSEDDGMASEGPGEGARAQMVVEVSPKPAAKGEIAVDGEMKGKTPPLTLTDLEPGSHRLEVRFPGFEPVDRQVDLKAGELQTVEIALDSDPHARGQLTLTVEPEEAEPRVFVDGEERNSSPFELELEPGRHLVEVVAPGYRTWSRVVDFSPGDAADVTVSLAPSAATVTVDVDREAVVTVDGEEIGESPAEVTGLDPTELHELEVDPTGDADAWKTVFGFPALGRETWEVSVDSWPPSHRRSDYGWLEITTGEDWWNVSLEGLETGVRTPVEGESRLPVLAGDRSLTLRRGGVLHEIDIEIEAGEPTEVALERPFEWRTKDGE